MWQNVALKIWRERSSFRTGFLVFFLLSGWIPGDQVCAQEHDTDQQPLLGEMRLRFEHLTTDDGLPSNTIEFFFQDETGFLWIGTWGGLVRYDGYMFVVHRHDPEDVHSISGDIVHDLVEDREGNLWVGTHAGLSKFNPRTEVFEHFQHDPDDPSSLSVNHVFRLLQDDDGTLWLATIGGGLEHFDPRSGRFTHYSHDPDDPNSLGSKDVHALHRDHQGTLWVGTQGGGLNRFEPASGTFQRYLEDPADPSSLGDDGIWALAEDRDGSLWVGTNDAGLNRLDPATGRFTRFAPDPGTPGALGGKFVFDLHEDRRGDFWVTLHDNGLYRMDRSTGSFTAFLHNPLDPFSLSENALTTVFEDDLGVLWIGTFASGINKLDRGAAKFRLYQHELNNEQSLVGNHVQAIFEDRVGNLWVGTDGEGLTRYDPAAGTYRHFVHQPKDSQSLSNNKVQVFYEDREGVLWIGTWGKGLNRFDTATQSFKHYVHDPLDPTSLSFDDVRGLHETPDGALWVATTYGGLNRFDRQKEHFTHFVHDAKNSRSLGPGVTTTMIGDAQGPLWLGLWGGGLNRFDPATGLFTRYAADATDPDAISHNEVWALYRDDQDRFWVGTSGGLDLFDPARGSFSHYGLADGLPSRAVYVIVGDLSGNLWLGTGNGLCRFDPEERTFRTYDKEDGLQGQSWNDGGAFRTRSGEIFIGGAAGLNSFFPAQVKENTFPPPVVLTDFQLFNQEVDIGGEDSPLKVSITDTEELTLRHDQSVFTLSFAGLGYRNPEKNRYRFRLEGVDASWNEVNSKRRYATYTTLPAGDYRFQVEASNNDGLWGEEGRALLIHVLPPYWQTWWFRASIALVVGALLWGGFLLRTAGMRAHNMALKEEVEERRRAEVALTKSNLELEGKNAEMERYTYSVSHDLMNPLVTIRGFAGAIRKDLERGDFFKTVGDLDRIDHAAERMQNLLQDLLELSRVGRVVHEPETLALSTTVREAAENLAPILAGHRVTLDIAPDMPEVLADPVRLLEALQNLLENAAKFMGDQVTPQIVVSARREGEEVVCTVADNGGGIEPDYHEKVFELFERLDPSIHGTGVGLALVRRIIEFQGGRIWVESSGSGQGSQFHFTLPGA